MSRKHTVEKIGGVCMSRFKEILKNIFFHNCQPNNYYNRIFVVSAYDGITNLLLEHKKTGAPGVYGLFANGNNEWKNALENVKTKMYKINHLFEEIGLDIKRANIFVNERLKKIETFLSTCSFVDLPVARENLSAVGEAHSAYNSALILQANNINAKFIDLADWERSDLDSIKNVIKQRLDGIDLSRTLPIVTGYVKCSEGMMKSFDRGYSEVTFSQIATLTNAVEGIIHKEFHLSTGDPTLIGKDKVKIIENTNFETAIQLADIGMEAIHPYAAKKMKEKNIPLRIKNAFDPNHPGTLISKKYKSSIPKVDMICAKNNASALETINTDHTTIICAVGSNLDNPTFLQKSVSALANANIKAKHSPISLNSIRFTVNKQDIQKAQIVMHNALIEEDFICR